MVPTSRDNEPDVKLISQEKDPEEAESASTIITQSFVKINVILTEKTM